MSRRPRRQWPPSYDGGPPIYYYPPQYNQSSYLMGEAFDTVEMALQWHEEMATKIKKELEEKKKKDEPQKKKPSMGFGEALFAVLFFGPIITGIQFLIAWHVGLKYLVVK